MGLGVDVDLVDGKRFGISAFAGLEGGNFGWGKVMVWNDGGRRGGVLDMGLEM